MPHHDAPPVAVAHLLQPGEPVDHHAEVLEGMITVTDRRVIVQDDHRLAFDMPFTGLRRIQLDIERWRPSTVVLVPEEPENPPRVLTVTASQLHDVAAALVTCRIDGTG
jgi:hypothetical protein